jgi:hypothetical protein
MRLTVVGSGDAFGSGGRFAAGDVEVFLCEGCSPHPVRWHLDLDTLAGYRDRLTCRQLVLTHLSATALASDLTSWQVAHDDLQLGA